MKLFTYATSPYARKVQMMLDYKGIAYEPVEPCYSLDGKEDLRAMNRCASTHGVTDEFEGPDGRIHRRDGRPEWPIRHGFIDAVVAEYRAAKMMFPPDAA